MSTWSDAVRLAVGTLTRWPVPPPHQVEPVRAARAMLLAPAVGLGMGALGAAAAWLGGRLGLAPLLTAALVVAGWGLATRGLHLDGLADTADGLASGRPAAEALEVMRRSDVGPAGAATLALVLMAQVVALAQATASWGPIACLIALAASRIALPLACRRGVPAARAGGLGAAVAGTVAPVAAVTAATLTALVVVVVGIAVAGQPMVAATGALSAVVAAAVAALVLTRVAVRRLGGITGDVLGWLVELCLLAALVTLAAASTVLPAV